jgi:uncharacterized membrane protein (DUF2068 family)
MSPPSSGLNKPSKKPAVSNAVATLKWRRHFPPKLRLTVNRPCYTAEDRTLHNHCCENLRSYNYNTFHIFAVCMFKIHYLIIHHLRLVIPSGLFPSRFWTTYFPNLCHSCYMHISIHLSSFDCVTFYYAVFFSVLLLPLLLVLIFSTSFLKHLHPFSLSKL